MDDIATTFDWAIRVHWLWLVMVGIFGGAIGSGAMYALLRKYLLPKEILELRKEVREKISKLHEEIPKIKKQLANLQKVDPGYTVISWWDPPTTLFGIILGNKENYPRDILIKKTGEIKELPDRRKIKSGL